jgi:hypothetical protein
VPQPTSPPRAPLTTEILKNFDILINISIILKYITTESYFHLVYYYTPQLLYNRELKFLKTFYWVYLNQSSVRTFISNCPMTTYPKAETRSKQLNCDLLTVSASFLRWAPAQRMLTGRSAQTVDTCRVYINNLACRQTALQLKFNPDSI